MYLNIFYLIKSNKFPDRPYFFNGSIDSGHADHQSHRFHHISCFSIGSDSAVYLCMRIWAFSFLLRNVFFRDIQYIYNAITVAWMYVTPMFYPIELLPDWLRKLVEYCNPMFIISSSSEILFIQTFTTPRIFIGCWVMAFIMLSIGLGVFKKTQDNFILYI